ncbi:MAG: hypothetical protein PHD05_00735 [Sphaerochaetaceae bacterium]|nr:hypothetical protein [Sphaerochaetaceae bacterium]
MLNIFKLFENVNPRGFLRPRDGRGKGVGMPGGQRQGRNTESCPVGGPGYGQGQGQGQGKYNNELAQHNQIMDQLIKFIGRANAKKLVDLMQRNSEIGASGKGNLQSQLFLTTITNNQDIITVNGYSIATDESLSNVDGFFDLKTKKITSNIGPYSKKT